MDTKERLMEFIDFKGLKASEFERISGLGHSYVAKIKNSIGKLGVMNIRRAFPELNIDWLLTGEGEMLNLPSSSGGVCQSIHQSGDYNRQSVTVNKGEMDRLLDMMDACHEMMKRKDEQIERLIALMEKKAN